jgi:hypothetical protein
MDAADLGRNLFKQRSGLSPYAPQPRQRSATSHQKPPSVNFRKMSWHGFLN